MNMHESLTDGTHKYKFQVRQDSVVSISPGHCLQMGINSQKLNEAAGLNIMYAG